LLLWGADAQIYFKRVRSKRKKVVESSGASANQKAITTTSLSK
jgi:hypothetical protein